MYKYNWTTSEDDLVDWNNFLKSSNKGYGTQTSPWLKSYRGYGFDCELLTVKKNNELVGGLGIVISKFAVVKIVSCPFGPIIKSGHENIFNKVIQIFRSRSIELGAMGCQINVPILKTQDDYYSRYCLKVNKEESILKSARKGKILKEVSAVNGFRSVEISYESRELVYENVFKTFNQNTKRNIKKAQTNNLKIEFAQEKSDIENAYRLIKNNADRKGYAVRDFEDFSLYLFELIDKKLCVMPVCKYNGEIYGVLILFEIGNRLTYIMGGIKNVEKDLKIGHFMHNEMIKYSIVKQYKFYDISVGGSPGVKRFKDGFNGKHLEIEGSYYWVNNPIVYRFYTFFAPTLRKNKKLVSKILKFFS